MVAVFWIFPLFFFEYSKLQYNLIQNYYKEHKDMKFTPRKLDADSYINYEWVVLKQSLEEFVTFSLYVYTYIYRIDLF